VLAADPAKLDAAEDLAVAGVRSSLGRRARGARNLSRASLTSSSTGRPNTTCKLTGNAQAPLAGHVLWSPELLRVGLRYRAGLVEAGAAVAFCDIDEPGVGQAAPVSADPRRALAVRMDVTASTR